MSYLLVFLGGGIGAALRHGVNRGASALWVSSFQVATLFVNVVGSLVMGMLAQLFLTRGGASQDVRLFFATGLLGRFTTFSAFSLDAVTMWQRAEYVAVGIYVAASVIMSVGALLVGIIAVRTLT